MMLWKPRVGPVGQVVEVERLEQQGDGVTLLQRAVGGRWFCLEGSRVSAMGLAYRVAEVGAVLWSGLRAG